MIQNGRLGTREILLEVPEGCLEVPDSRLDVGFDCLQAAMDCARVHSDRLRSPSKCRAIHGHYPKIHFGLPESNRNR